MSQQFVPILDTSGWQAAYAGNGKLKDGAQPFELAKAQALGVQGIIHRIGNGTRLDESFRLAYDSAKKDTDLAFGAYYYVQPNYITAPDAAALIEDWLLDGEYELDLPVMLDLEEYNGSIVPKHKLGQYVRVLVTELTNRLGRTPLIYTGAWWWNEHVDGNFTDIDTIQARYPRHGVQPPSDTAEWTEWAMNTGKPPRECIGLRGWDGWQFTADLDGGAFGMPADRATNGLDGNIIHREAWERWSDRELIEPAPAPEPPADDDDDIDYSDWPAFRPAQGEYGLYPFDTNKRTLSPGDDGGNDVKYLQGVIKRKAGGDQPCSGKYDDHTVSRVKDVQAFFEITVDGIVGWDGSDGTDAGTNATWPIIDFLAGQPDSA